MKLHMRAMPSADRASFGPVSESFSGFDFAELAFGAPGVLRAVTSAGLYMAVVTMVGFGLGAIVRHTGGAMAATAGVVFLAWPAASAVD